MFKVKKEITGPLQIFGGLFNEKSLITSGTPVFLPFYHYVGDQPAFLDGLYNSKTIDAFESDLEYMAMHFTFIDSNALLNLVNGSLNPDSFDKPPLHLSFDDGLKCCYDTIVPILKKRAIPATFFISSKFHEGKDVFYRYKVALLNHHLKKSSNEDKRGKIIQMIKDLGKWKKTLNSSLLQLTYLDNLFINQLVESAQLNLRQEDIYMTMAQIKELRAQGFSLGGHSVDHPMYDSIGAKEQINQTVESIDWIAKNFNVNNRLFAFPFTDSGVDAKFYDEVLTNGKADLVFGTAGLKRGNHRRHLQRVPMEMYSTNPKVRIKTEYLYHHILKLIIRSK